MVDVGWWMMDKFTKNKSKCIQQIIKKSTNNQSNIVQKSIKNLPNIDPSL